MKYCKKCKIAAKESDTVCSKCKAPLSTFGSATASAAPKPPGPKPAPAPSPTPTSQKPSATAAARSPQPLAGAATATVASKVPTFTLSGQIAELEQIKQKNLNSPEWLALVCSSPWPF